MKRSKRKKINLFKVLLTVLILFILVFIIYKIVSQKEVKEEKILMINIVNKDIAEAKNSLSKYNLDIEISYEYSETVSKDKVIKRV